MKRSLFEQMTNFCFLLSRSDSGYFQIQSQKMIANATRVAARPAAAYGKRSLVTATKPLRGGDGHDVHRVFDGKPFSKVSSGLITFGLGAVALAIPTMSVRYQNKKHGFA